MCGQHCRNNQQKLPASGESENGHPITTFANPHAFLGRNVPLCSSERLSKQWQSSCTNVVLSSWRHLHSSAFCPRKRFLVVNDCRTSILLKFVEWCVCVCGGSCRCHFVMCSNWNFSWKLRWSLMWLSNKLLNLNKKS